MAPHLLLVTLALIVTSAQGGAMSPPSEMLDRRAISSTVKVPG